MYVCDINKTGGYHDNTHLFFSVIMDNFLSHDKTVIFLKVSFPGVFYPFTTKLPVFEISLTWVISAISLVQEVPQFFGAGGVAEFAEGFGLDLTDALTGYVEFLANFLKSACSAVLNAESQTQNLFLARRKG